MSESKEGTEGWSYKNVPINVPIQVFCLIDTNGRLNPLRFRYENKEHQIETAFIEEIISRDEKHYVGIWEKQFICVVMMGDVSRTVEIRYHVDSQKWRIFRFLN